MELRRAPLVWSDQHQLGRRAAEQPRQDTGTDPGNTNPNRTDRHSILHTKTLPDENKGQQPRLCSSQHPTPFNLSKVELHHCPTRSVNPEVIYGRPLSTRARADIKRIW